MKTIITLIVLAFAFVTTTQAQVEKVLVKSVALDGNSLAVVNLPGEVSVLEWDKDYIRVTATVNVLNFDDNIAKRLVVVGRYELKTETVEGQLVITMPKISNLVTIKGTLLQETFSFEVQSPKGYQVIVKTSAQAEEGTIGQNL